jgi:catechol 2,3-dioxygenase-like lactoylglutathione lyase family enzyme
VSLSTDDLGSSLVFYSSLFGMEPIPTPNFGFPVQWLKAGEAQLHLFERPGEPATYHHVAFTVDDFEEVYMKARDLDIFDDVTFGHHLYELPGDCAQLYLRDPGGNLVEVNAPGASRLSDRVLSDIKQLSDAHPQNEENLRATLFLST